MSRRPPGAPRHRHRRVRAIAPRSKTLKELRPGGIEVEALPTADAVRCYKELDPHRTAAALHLTC
jgi:hypothetical protein